MSNPGLNVMGTCRFKSGWETVENRTGQIIRLGWIELYMKTFNEIHLQKTELLLKTYTGENILLLLECLRQMLSTKWAPINVGSVCLQKQRPCIDGLMYWLYNNNNNFINPLQDTLRLVCHQITEHFTSYTICQRASGHVFEDNLGTFYGMILLIEC